MGNLTVAEVKAAKPGKHYDRHGLMLRVQPTGSRQWVWRGTVHGRRVELGAGSFPYVTLREARETAFEFRKVARRGGDPRQQRRRIPTFGKAAEDVIALHRPAWRSNTERRWRAMFDTYAGPLERRRIDTITTAEVLAVLAPIWHRKATTAKLLRQRLGAVFAWAVANDYRADNPAEAVAAALPKQSNRKAHHAALPPGKVAAALRKLRKVNAPETLRLALEFAALTATRSGEVRGATWAEIDGDVWTIPGDRMKAGRPHRVPLPPAALAVLDRARALRLSAGLIFPATGGKAIHQSRPGFVLRQARIGGTLHGFRSSFRSWCADEGIDREVAETCLAHVNKNATEAAYQRSDLLDRRRAVMERWAAFLGL